jgi:hypothetical protein
MGLDGMTLDASSVLMLLPHFDFRDNMVFDLLVTTCCTTVYQ